MKRRNQWMLAAILTICGTLTMGLTSCTESIDNPVTPVNPVDPSEVTEAELQQALLGLHLDVSDYIMGSSDMRIWDLHDDKSFTAYDLYIDEETNEFTIDTLKGNWKPEANLPSWWSSGSEEKMQGFSVTYQADQDIPSSDEDTSDLFLAFLLEDEDGTADAADSEDIIVLSALAVDWLAEIDSINAIEAQDGGEASMARTRATTFGNTTSEAIKTVGGTVSDGVKTTDMSSKESMKALYDNVANLISGASSIEFFNPNKDAFTEANWRSEQNIWIYDPQGNKEYVDQKTGLKYNFRAEPLPWNEQSTVSNLPLEFCDDVTPENGWHLVMNYCGNTSGFNKNFFAVYNRYTGALRFFVYVPKINVSTANDHAWEVSLLKETAEHLGLKYGLPLSNQIVDKNLLGMDGADYSFYVTPYVGSQSFDQKITPAEGWWAFDVDLSSYRPNYRPLLEKIRLQMRAWNSDEVSLKSDIKAKIKEPRYQETQSLSLSSLFGLYGKGKDTFSKAAGIIKDIANFSTGGFFDTFESIIGIAQRGYNLVQGVIKESKKFTASKEPVYVLKQTFEGTISTTGLVKGSRAVSGMAATTIAMSEFETANSTLGQGVWNLTNAPVVYETNCYYAWTNQDINGLLPEDLGQNRGFVYIFDPTSVDVVLNPNVFNSQNVEYIEVKSACGVRKDLKPEANDDFRKGIGMAENKPVDRSAFRPEGISGTDPEYKSKFNEDINNPCMDYLYGETEGAKESKYPLVARNYTKNGKMTYHLIGRGQSADYLIEPLMVKSWDDARFGNDSGLFKLTDKPREEGADLAPCYEVSVVLIVKMVGVDKPLVFTRTYLPVIKRLRDTDFSTFDERLHADLKKIQAEPLRRNHTSYLEKQVAHIPTILSLIRPNYKMVGTFYLQAAQYNNRNLFDGDYNTYWSKSSRYKEGDGRWRVYFNSSRPIMIKSYSIVTCNLSRYVPEENPTRWSLYGIRNNEKVILDWRDSKTPGEALSDKPGVKSNYEVRYNNKEPLQLFVFECPAAVSKTWWKYAVGGFGREEVTIAEIELHE